MSDTEVIVYHVVVYEPEPVAAQWNDEMDPPMVDGLIALNSEEFDLLERRLALLSAEGYIQSFSLDAWEPTTPKSITSEGILNFIAGIDEPDSPERQMWAYASTIDLGDIQDAAYQLLDEAHVRGEHDAAKVEKCFHCQFPDKVLTPAT